MPTTPHPNMSGEGSVQWGSTWKTLNMSRGSRTLYTGEAPEPYTAGGQDPVQEGWDRALYGENPLPLWTDRHDW